MTEKNRVSYFLPVGSTKEPAQERDFPLSFMGTLSGLPWDCRANAGLSFWTDPTAVGDMKPPPEFLVGTRMGLGQWVHFWQHCGKPGKEEGA